MTSRLIGILILACAANGGFAAEHHLTVKVVDADSGQPIPCRLYLHDSEGQPFYFSSSSEAGTAFRYQKRNWINKQSTEFHTTVTAHPSTTTVPAGDYTLIVERGKTYFPHRQQIKISGDDVVVSVALQRWIDPASLGWYSGDTHIHRELHELRNIVLAEDLNVVFPLTNWVTLSDTPPSAGDKNLDVLGDELIRVDDTHVIWPRNTEYEIFRVGKQRHTLGALFVLGHKGALQQVVPPWKPVVDAARQADPNVLFDMDKLAWPFSMTLPVIAPDSTYELINNHMWRTEFAFREWYTPTPPFIQPPFGGTEGGENEWIDFTLGMYYTLLNCGFHLPPSAGTANGVHPVPAGFGRVYVHLPDGFDYQSWRRGLQQGRSFVTTGPMLFATADGKHPGHTFKFQADAQPEIPIHVEVVSEQPISFGEILINGRPEHLLRARREKTETGAFRCVIDQTIKPTKSGWFAIRFFEDRGEGRARFAHTAPWYLSFDGQEVRPSWEEREYLISRMQNEMQRSRGVVSEPAMAEYRQALDFYGKLEVADDAARVERNGRSLQPHHRDQWLKNMIVDHRFNADEVRQATGLTIGEAEQAVQRFTPLAAESGETANVRLRPYPGGRHPRRGFLDGAIDPQRETKISVFPPWSGGGYAVVDVPEAIFSNLGLTYLAHTHVPTIWTENSTELEKLEWTSTETGLELERKLPNGIAFGSRVGLADHGVAMEMWLTNGTDQRLTGMRSQVCVMLKGLVGFNSQRRRTQFAQGPFIAIRGDRSSRWVITAWQPNHRTWDNPPVPCIHSDPIFPDCEPGQTVQVKGGLWFYEGDEIKAEVQRLQHHLR